MKNKKIYYINLLMLLMLLTGCGAADQSTEQVQTNIASEKTAQSDILQTEPILSQEHENTETSYFNETAESDTEKIMNMAENKDIDILVKQLEILIQRNEFEGFLFQSEEKAICIYEGTIEFDTMNDKFALYKETVEKDIVFVNMIFIEKETGNIYTWREEELIQIGALERVKLELTNSSKSEIDNNLLYENITEDELLDKVMEALEQIGCNKLNLIYDGRIEFVNRNYYMISSFDDFEDRILREQRYYIDCKNGYIYRVGENTDFLRTELYYITNLQ